MRRSAVTFSASLHIIAMIIAVMGLPFFKSREFIIPPPIVVDFVEISKVTETDKVQPPAPPVKEEKKEPPAPAKNTSAEPVVPVPKDKVTPPEEKKEPKKAEPAIDPNALPDKKKPPKKEEEVKTDPQKNFSAVLKNLIDPKDKVPVKADTPDLKLNEKAPSPGQNAPIGAKLTMSEEDALRGQLESCWNVPLGAKDMENMIVEIFMVINPDRTLREARVVDTSRYNSDTFYRAAADSALRAVRSPLCSPFKLPPDKYDTWNTTTVTFNPKDMF